VKAQSGMWFHWTGSRTWSQPGHGIPSASPVQMIVVFCLSSCLCSEYSGWSLMLFYCHVVTAWHCHHQGLVTLHFVKLPSVPLLPSPHPLSHHKHNLSWTVNRLYGKCTWDSTMCHAGCFQQHQRSHLEKIWTGLKTEDERNKMDAALTDLTCLETLWQT
jgi:hypothetical protein